MYSTSWQQKEDARHDGLVSGNVRNVGPLARGDCDDDFLILVVVGLAFFTRPACLRSGDGSTVALESPEAILKRRYAKGEIDKTEFEEKRKDVL